MKYYLAIDIGASSGRHIIGYLNEKNELITEEMYRFSNGLDLVDGHKTWNVERLFKEVKNGIKKCLEKYKNIASMSIDTWGVDYVLMNGEKEILPCYAYRDERTKEVINKVHSLISFDELYKITGSQFQEFNTIYQLFWDKIHGRLDQASDFLMIPEYLMYKLTGIKKNEYTNASTTGMMDKNSKFYSQEIITKLGFKPSLFNKLHKQGTLVGDFKDDVQIEVGGNIKVVLCSTHDTASAVEGIDIQNDTLYISSGTWSLLGLKTKEVINSQDAQKANYSNEYGPNYIRFQKNIMGLWIIQGLAKQMNLDFPTMVKMAKESTFHSVFDVNDQCFLSSLDMKSSIQYWFKERKLEIPLKDEDLTNTTYISLAYSYKVAIEEIEKITNKQYKDLYIVGGGAKNQYLNELTKFYTKKNVIALPIEATALGNLKAQIKGDIYEKSCN